MVESRKSAVFLVTNDLTFDQRLQKKCATLQELMDIVLLGRERSNSIAVDNTLSYQSIRLKCVFNRSFLFYLEFNIRAFFYLRKLRPDIVCCNDSDTLLAGIVYKYFSPSVVLSYDSHELFYEVPELLEKPFVRWIWKTIEKRSIPRVNFTYTVNESLANILGKRYNRNFEVIRNLPYKNSEIIAPIDKERVIIYQGALNRGRCLELIIATMPLLPEYTLWLVGDGDLKEELHEMTQASSAKNRIKFFGKLRPAELKEITKKAMLGYNLLEGDSPNYYYSLANKFFDYMMAGIPSINNDFPEYQSLFSAYKMGILIEELNKESLATSILELASDSESMSEMIAESNRAKHALHWGNESKKLLALYNQYI